MCGKNRPACISSQENSQKGLEDGWGATRIYIRTLVKDMDPSQPCVVCVSLLIVNLNSEEVERILSSEQYGLAMERATGRAAQIMVPQDRTEFEDVKQYHGSLGIDRLESTSISISSFLS